MRLILGGSQYSHIGYPALVFYLVAGIGFTLIFFRPFWAFLFSVFCFTARDFHAAVFTRPSPFGSYLNLNDLLLWIALIALFIESIRKKKTMWAPPILLAIFGLIIIGDFQSIFKYGLCENVLRRIWSTAIFPIMFLIATNTIYNTKRAKKFYWALFFGATLAATTHMIFIYQRISLYGPNMETLRTISYSANCGSPILIGSIFVLLNLELGYLRKTLYHIGLILLGLSILFSFTRSLWVISIISFIFLPFLIRKKVSFSRISIKIGVGIGIGILLVLFLFPKLELGNMLTERVRSFTHRESFAGSYRARSEGTQTELNTWFNNSSLILGVGSCLPQEFMDKRYDYTGALGHVAYSIYLANYGLLGLLIYLVFLNILTIKTGRYYYLKHLDNYGKVIAIIGVAAAIMNISGFFTSTCYLGATTQVEGLLYGAIWGLHRGYSKDKDTKYHENEAINSITKTN